MFDLSIEKLLILAILAVVIFGPDQLPKVAAQAGRTLRELRRIADGARNDLRDGLGPEFSEFDFNDLNPRSFVRKHLIDGLDDDDPLTGADSLDETGETAAAAVLTPGEEPPYDAEAT